MIASLLESPHGAREGIAGRREMSPIDPSCVFLTPSVRTTFRNRANYFCAPALTSLWLTLRCSLSTSKSGPAVSMLAKTTLATPATVTAEWLHIDAADQVVGRLAVQIATVLRAKDKPTYTPHIDTGDFVVVTERREDQFTGKKWDQEDLPDILPLPGRTKDHSRPRKCGRAKARRDSVPGCQADGAAAIGSAGLSADGQAEDLRRLKAHPHQAQKPKEFNHVK